MSKRKHPTLTPKHQRAPTISWEEPRLYTKFLELCEKEFTEKNRNVFNSGKAREKVAERISKIWPGCTDEKVRGKLRKGPQE